MKRRDRLWRSERGVFVVAVLVGVCAVCVVVFFVIAYQVAR